MAIGNPGRRTGYRPAGAPLGAWLRGLRALALGALTALVLPMADALSAKLDFMGFVVDSMTGVFRIVKDVNVRAGPSTDAERVAQVAEGAEVEAVGKVKGGWIAVRRGGKDLGFVFESYLKPVSQPPLERDRAGRIVGATGKAVAPASGRFLAVAEIDVRAKPAKNAAKRGRLERGTRVEALGASDDGKWLAIRWSGQEMGFVPREALVALIDGDLRAPIGGQAKSAKGRCAFTIRFTGKSQVEDDIIETADYDVDWQCDIDGKQMTFPGYMFITEAPFQLVDNQTFQISVDLLEVAREYDEAFSTVFLYYRPDGKVVFDSVSMKELGTDPAVRELPAKSVREALIAAATMAPAAWSADLWSFLSEGAP